MYLRTYVRSFVQTDVHSYARTENLKLYAPSIIRCGGIKTFKRTSARRFWYLNGYIFIVQSEVTTAVGGDRGGEGGTAEGPGSDKGFTMSECGNARCGLFPSDSL